MDEVTIERWRSAGLVGGGVLAAGFGVMASFSRWLTYPADLPGLYTYRSATFGDGICLPIVAAALQFGSAGIELNRRERLLVAACATLGAAAGFATQVAWLRDPHPRLNWTLTAPGHFNPPGWYHAAFLVGASGFFAGLWTRAVLVLARADVSRQISRRARLSCVPAVGASAAFVSLLVSDNQQSAHTASGSATTAAATSAVITLGIGVFALGIVRRRRVLRHLGGAVGEGQQPYRSHEK